LSSHAYLVFFGLPPYPLHTPPLLRLSFPALHTAYPGDKKYLHNPDDCYAALRNNEGHHRFGPLLNIRWQVRIVKRGRWVYRSEIRLIAGCADSWLQSDNIMTKVHIHG